MLGTDRLFLGLLCLVGLVGAVSDAIVYCDYSDEKRNKIWKPKKPEVKKPVLTESEVVYAVERAHQSVLDLHRLEHDLYVNHVYLDRKCPSFKNSAFRRAKKSSLKKAEQAEEALYATLNIAKKKHLSRKDRKFALAEISLTDSVFAKSCFEEPKCDYSSKYRTIDGSCNNYEHPKWGQAETAFIRILEPDYGNGLTTPRLASDDKPLPSSRIVSTHATINKSKEKRQFTLMVMQWGQFLDHDITLTPVVTAPEDFAISCCPKEVNDQFSLKLHPACFPISIPPNDNFYKKYHINCMDFVRSLPAIRRDCTYGYREQMNQITSYIDASNVYGSDKEDVKALRLFKNGLLKYHKEGDKFMLPPHPHSEECEEEEHACFRAGDSRVNEQPSLAIMHTLWMRQHNKIAKELKGINPSWKDEKLFQETRRIVGAQMQHITYNEWLPIILGPAFMRKNNLKPQKKGYSNSYDTKVDASIANEFAAAAFRFGHTLIQPELDAYSYDLKKTKSWPLKDVAFKPGFLYGNGTMDPLILGLTQQRSQRFDNIFPPDLKTKLFSKEGHGLDIVALNIQRGRDHGLPSYIEYREVCGLGKVTSFDDLRKDISKKNIARLKKIYKSVKDIDLFIAGVMEKPKRGALIGMTFRCIIGEQFERLKTGDRFFYENGEDTKTRFTPAQLKEIRKTSLARILCDNGQNIKKIQPSVFRRSAKYVNKVVSCSNQYKIPKLDLNKWKQ